MDGKVWVDRPRMPPPLLVMSAVSSIASTRGGIDIEGKVRASGGDIVESDMIFFTRLVQ